MPLNPQQKKAVEYLDGPLLVLAGPGTGKTQLLSEKVVYILKNTDTNPENILCLTFTETGAINMRERLKSIIGKDGLKVNIGTYHSFGSEILLQYKNYAPEYNRRLDAAIDEVTQFKIIKKIRDELPGTDILRGDNVRDIISVISEAKSAGLSAEDLAEVATVNIKDSELIKTEVAPLFNGLVDRNFKLSYENAYRPIYEKLVALSEINPEFKKNPELAEKVERILVNLRGTLREALIEAEADAKIPPLTAWRNANFEKDPKGNYRLKNRIANLKLQSIATVMAKYQKYLEAEGLYDFDDMILEAVRILTTDEGFKLTLEERYQYIMLDEFQDTNPSQLAIVKALTDYEKPNIMAVGDDDQAIYEFQGAKSTNLTDFQRYYSANVIPLIENYRSTQEILDFSRKIINEAPDRFADKELFAHKENPATSQIYRHEFMASEQEYDFIAKTIVDLIKNGVSQNEIAIISYKTKYFLPLLPFLKARPEIKIAYEKQDDLFLDPAIHQILTMARLAFNLMNGQPVMGDLVEVLAYPFFNLPNLEIVKLLAKSKSERKSALETFSSSENPEIEAVMKFLADLAAKALTEPLEIFLDFLIGASELSGYRSPFLKYYTEVNRKESAVYISEKIDEYSAFRLYENLASLRGKLKRHFGDRALKLENLLEFIRDYEEAEMGLNTTSPYKEADEAVQILTAHRSKGLEFKYVFILSADHTAWGKGKGNNNLLALPKNLAFIRHTGTTDGEKLRILYVALTRAKETLFITNSKTDFTGKSPERLEYLEETVEKTTDGKEIIVSPLIPSGRVIQHEESAVVISENRETDPLKLWLSPFFNPTPDMRAIYREKIANYRLSATALTSFVDLVYAGPKEFFKRYILGLPSDPETEQLATGNLIHKVFEAITKDGISDEEAEELFLSELEKRPLPSEITTKIREKGPHDLKVALQSFGKLLHQGEAEVDLVSEKININGVPVTGKIDHLIADEATKTLEIYDFKTANYHKEKWRSHLALYKYALQLEFYKLLLKNSAKYAKYKIEKAHILFVTPDHDGEVYDKVYEFEPENEAEILKLLSSVYAEVSTLSFLDDPEIFVEPDATRKLSDIKDFVEKIIKKHA